LSELSKDERRKIYRIARSIARYQVEHEMREGIVKPSTKKVSIWPDDHLWKPLGYTMVKISTHKGWVVVELQPHKQYWMYINNGWRLRTQPKLKLDEREQRLYVYLVFEKDVKRYEPRGYVSVDVNENNVTMLVDDDVKFITLMRSIILRYYRFRREKQKKFTAVINGKKYPLYQYCRRLFRRLREKWRKRDWRVKIARIIVYEAKRRGYGIIVEDLPKKAPEKMINDVNDRKLRHRIYQSAFKGMVKAIVDIAEKEKVPVVKVDPKGTSSIRPVCGSNLMRSNAPKVLTCPGCGYSNDRDVIACLNLWMKGSFRSTLKPMNPYLEVAVLPMKIWVKVNSLGAIINLYETFKMTT